MSATDEASSVASLVRPPSLTVSSKVSGSFASIVSGACSSVVTLEVHDASGNSAPVTAATTVTLAKTGVAFSLFSNATCTTPLGTSLSLAAGVSAAYTQQH